MNTEDFEASYDTLIKHDGKYIEAVVAYTFMPAEDETERDGYYVSVFDEDGNDIFDALTKEARRCVMRDVDEDRKAKDEENEYNSIDTL